MMKHYPYEGWILDDIDLDETRRADLEAHLALCPQCAQLSRSLRIALQAIRNAPEQTAPAGFVHKFVSSFEARRRLQERKQARTLAIVFASTALIVVLVSLYVFLPELSLISLAAAAVSAVVGLLEGFQQVVSFISNAYKNLSPSTLIISGLVFAGWVLLASLTLGLSVWKLAFRKSEVKQ